MKNILDYFYNIKEWYQTTNNKQIACIRNYFDKNETLSVTILWICFVLGIPLIMLLAASAIMALIISLFISLPFLPFEKYLKDNRVFHIIAISIFVILTIFCGCVIIYLQVQYDIF